MTTRRDLARRGPLPPGSRVGIVAGEGRLPLDIATHLAGTGRPPFVALAGRPEHTARELRAFDHAELALERATDLVPMLKTHGVTHLVLAGGIARRPKLTALRPSLALLRLLPGIVRSLRQGDDGLLRFIVGQIERNGIKVLGAHEIVPDLLAAAGPLTERRPNARDERDLAAAWMAARAIGQLDVGQAAVAIGGRAVALEGIEGTDGLLERVRALRGHGRIEGINGGALVKCAKPGQELRADLPTIGPDTVTRAHAAGLAGIGVEAERSLLLDQGRLVAEADRLGLFVVGLR